MRLIDADMVEQILRDMAKEEDYQNALTSWSNAMDLFADLIRETPAFVIEGDKL